MSTFLATQRNEKREKITSEYGDLFNFFILLLIVYFSDKMLVDVISKTWFYDTEYNL